MKVPTNLLRDAFRYYTVALEPFYGIDESKKLVFALTEHYFAFDRLKLAMEPDYRLSESEMLTLHFAAKDLLAGKPLQYIIGLAVFYGHKFMVNPSVLIPRPETEELVSLAADFCSQQKQGIKVLDVGTGSGCIAITLQKLCPSAKVWACDISHEALSVARHNATLLGADIDFFVCDIISYDTDNQTCKYDLIVSNPPYVTVLDKSSMKTNVLDWEPHLALFAPEDDPLYFFRKIASLAMNCLKPSGKLMVEINENAGEAVHRLFLLSGFVETSICHDIHGKERFVICTKK